MVIPLEIGALYQSHPADLSILLGGCVGARFRGRDPLWRVGERDILTPYSSGIKVSIFWNSVVVAPSEQLNLPLCLLRSRQARRYWVS